MTETRTAPATGWVGWIAFAGIMMIIIGCLQAIYGLVAVLNDEWVLWGNGDAVVIDITVWGWIHLLVGVLLVLAGLGVLAGNALARAVGVVVAAVSLIGSFMSLPLYPLWTLIVIALDVFVIWALVAHGSEMKRV